MHDYNIGSNYAKQGLRRINLGTNLALALLTVDVLHRKITKTMPSDIQGSGLKPDIIAHHPDKQAAQP